MTGEEGTCEHGGKEETSHPVHRILIMKQTSVTNILQVLVQSSESLKECKKVFDQIMKEHGK